MSEQAESRRVGEVVGGKYRLVRFLAAGGMGTVYEARHTVVHRRVAVKLLHPDLAQQRESLTRFQREAQAAGELESENVAAAVDFGITDDGSPFIVMEYLAGESLRAVVDRCQRLPVGRATDIVMQACRGVQAAHEAGIVHRDLNPHNLFLCRREDGTDWVKVLDFGIAKLESIENTETRTGTVLGTPAYLSPEQARGEKTVDHRTDIYGLGAVLYELLAGARPHPGESRNAIIHHICTQPAQPLDGDALDLPPALVACVHRALRSDPGARQASVAAFAEEIAPWAKREVWPPVKSDGGDVVGADRSSGGMRADPAKRAKPSRPHAKVIVCIAAAVGLAGFAFVAAIRPAGHKPRGPVDHPLPAGARFYAPPPDPAAVQQIAALARSNASREAAVITAMEALPHAVWFEKGSPEEVQEGVSNTMMRASRDQSIPILVTSNRPYRDCAGQSAGGAKDTAAFKSWIDGFVRGIGNGRAVVLVEPGTTGLLPYHTRLDGSADWCKPTLTDERGRTAPVPGATAEEVFAQIGYATKTLAKQAPNTIVYLDGTHGGWLPVGDVAYRLVKLGVFATQGFVVNVTNFQPTSQSIRFGTWVAKCIHYATQLARDKGSKEAFHRCAGQPFGSLADDEAAWARTEAWYADNVVSAAPTGLVHFVIDTSRNGRKPLDPAYYAEAPYHQPAAVIRELIAGAWCNPPGRGLGLRPTADTGVPLLDAYLWVKIVGQSDGSCDIAGGARAWDFDQYNPWGIAGEGQKHFDPLWGMVTPAAGSWFPEQALELALNAEPSLSP